MNKSPILIAGLILGGFAVAGVGVVAMTNDLTAERIAANKRQAMLDKLEAIVPAGRVANDPLADNIKVSDPELLGAEQTEVFRVRDQADGPVAVILQPVVPDGYAGPIRLLVSVLHDGSLGGVRVLEHHETPGLGDRIDEKKTDWIVEQFNGKSLGDPPLEKWGVKRDGGDFDQFTGATITPRSVVKAVKNTLLFVQREGDVLYAPVQQGASPAETSTGSPAGNPTVSPTPTRAPAATAPAQAGTTHSANGEAG
ncbi:electron transport complex subunit RsxG [Thiohalocapsa sp.]|uniref:electron transport complex subunit RsxG n=1 Tax=Thiohalocapsa sp. TaxID=2497641 RepID=UPI00345B9877